VYNVADEIVISFFYPHGSSLFPSKCPPTPDVLVVELAFIISKIDFQTPAWWT